MKEKIEEFLKQKQQLTPELKEWVKDKSIPLEERWEVFFKSELGENSTYYEEFEHFFNEVYCNRLNKYQTLKLKDVEEYDWFPELSHEELIEFKEDVLSRFINSFKWDW